MEEHWKPIVGYEMSYEISDLGRVRKITHGIMKPETIKGNYLRVSLSSGFTRHRWPVHRLVARAFIGECPHGYVINHKDGNPANNQPDNLEYVTQRENILHSFRLLKRQAHHQGETTHFAKLTDNNVIQIRRLRSEGQTYKQIAAQFNTKPANIWHICIGKTWKHLL